MNETDEYRVRVWQSRCISLGPIRFGRRVWRVQIDYLSDWDEHGDQPLLHNIGWHPTFEDAARFGLETARGIYDDKADPSVPLVVWVGGRAVIDERTGGAR